MNYIQPQVILTIIVTKSHTLFLSTHFPSSFLNPAPIKPKIWQPHHSTREKNGFGNANLRDGLSYIIFDHIYVINYSSFATSL